MHQKNAHVSRDWMNGILELRVEESSHLSAAELHGFVRRVFVNLHSDLLARARVDSNCSMGTREPNKRGREAISFQATSHLRYQKSSPTSLSPNPNRLMMTDSTF